jgi:DNA-binding NarL/FixJ family response regulator
MTVRVVIADDHPMYRYGLGAVLEHVDSIEVVASVGDGSQLVRAVAEHHPDVVVTDLCMPDLDGVNATTVLLKRQPGLAVLVLTMHEDDEHLFAALRAGARGYLVKGAGGEEIVRGVMAVAAGDAVYGSAVAQRIVALFEEKTTGSPTMRAFQDLTPRERDVLELLAIGCRNHEIARRLSLSDKTVRIHVSQVLLKLRVPDRTAAALRAREAGIGSPDARDDAVGDDSSGPTAGRPGRP